MLLTWSIIRKRTQVYIALPELVVVDRRKVSDFHVTAAPSSGGASLLTTARAGSVSLCFKNDKAQTFGHLAPGCENELSGLDPANKAAFSFNEGHTETKGYSGGTGLCQLREDPTIKTPTGRDLHPELQSTNYVKEPRRTASHARSSRRLAVGIATNMGGIPDG